jgi:hypothetical protein
MRPLKALAGGIIGVQGRPVHVASIYRWCLHGHRGIKLRTLRSPGGLLSCEQWVREFFDALTAQDHAIPAPPPANDERLRRELERAGAI